jgi:hypothetical protein
MLPWIFAISCVMNQVGTKQEWMKHFVPFSVWSLNLPFMSLSILCCHNKVPEAGNFIKKRGLLTLLEVQEQGINIWLALVKASWHVISQWWERVQEWQQCLWKEDSEESPGSHNNLFSSKLIQSIQWDLHQSVLPRVVLPRPVTSIWPYLLTREPLGNKP